jgi:hypothetical protein
MSLVFRLTVRQRRANFQDNGGRFSWFVAACRQTAANFPALFSDGGALPRRRYADPGAGRKRLVFDRLASLPRKTVKQI